MTRDLINMLYHHALVECSQTLQVLRPVLHSLVKSLPTAASLALLCYLAAVRRSRFRGIKTLLDKYPDPTTPLRDIKVAHEVYSRTFLLDFPFIAGIGLEMTGLKTFAIPSISKVLVATKQDDYTYNLSLFVLEATRWIDRFEWRKLTDLEKNAILAIWTETGRAMGIEHIPGSVEEFEEWAETYESKKMVFAPSNALVAESNLAILGSVTPPVGSILRDFIESLMTPRLRAGLGYGAASRYKVWMYSSLLWLRGSFVKHLMLPRTVPLVRTALRAAKEGKAAEGQKTDSASGCPFSGRKRYITRFDLAPPPVYPQGYVIEELGPNRFLGKGPADVTTTPSVL
ncbi:hypothetical protein BGZ70_001599 [Mortierella alpina]|uniref:ER-bound oxygenase mpaB/mpaB'/Rubber oxygenase catalytic domain-containing protein n=1 Tax=Mortierella alpina TaxID=64518 RepID=A0A9P6LXU1_MORAP|nr:hypothetical protein BGZ70_001599 [Mortierella alpina]